MKNNVDLAVAFDHVAPGSLNELCNELKEAEVKWVKIGLELFTSMGPKSIEIAKQHEFNVFLDLKLFDIPNTVAQAVKAAVGWDVDLLTLHAMGGQEMMMAASGALTRSDRLRLLAVTVLTSFSSADLNILSSIFGRTESFPQSFRQSIVTKFANLAQECGVQGLVCSAQDLNSVNLELERNKKSLYLVTPGIRMNDDHSHDQKAIATPEYAVAHGANLLVVGRPILGYKSASERIQAAQRFLNAIKC